MRFNRLSQVKAAGGVAGVALKPQFALVNVCVAAHAFPLRRLS